MNLRSAFCFVFYLIGHTSLVPVKHCCWPPQRHNHKTCHRGPDQSRKDQRRTDGKRSCHLWRQKWSHCILWWYVLVLSVYVKYWYFKYFLSFCVVTLSCFIYYFVKCYFSLKAIKNSRENTLKRTYDMIEGPMSRAHSGRDGAPFEGNSFVFKVVDQAFVML